jgi:hypothetical protein
MVESINLKVMMDLTCLFQKAMSSSGTMDLACEYASVSTITPHSSSFERWRFTSRQPISSVATTSAGRAKKEWGRCWEGVVSMGVALCGSAEDW